MRGVSDFNDCKTRHTRERPEPGLRAGLLALVMWGFIQIFFPVGGVGETIFALLGALIFSGYLVFDTANLIQNYDLDQVRGKRVWGVCLHCDKVALLGKRRWKLANCLSMRSCCFGHCLGGGLTAGFAAAVHLGQRQLVPRVSLSTEPVVFVTSQGI